jgi:D-hexose-6-phosphate mutarotase
MIWGEMTRTAKAKGISRQREWQIRHRDQDRAHAAVQNALKSGRLIRPNTCTTCGQMGKTQAHHVDYSQRLQVQWLCQACHYRVHSDPRPHVLALERMGYRVSLVPKDERVGSR